MEHKSITPWYFTINNGNNEKLEDLDNLSGSVVNDANLLHSEATVPPKRGCTFQLSMRYGRTGIGTAYRALMGWQMGYNNEISVTIW